MFSFKLFVLIGKISMLAAIVMLIMIFIAYIIFGEEKLDVFFEKVERVVYFFNSFKIKSNNNYYFEFLITTLKINFMSILNKVLKKMNLV